ncbi:hypothetical protein C8K36_10823 [Rhodococcus sp. OK519]|uniref:hypothetical protein n=1 Tax=Rhodococcus sp. OK519 TaxID=2135729 RepID=UPI000D4784D9|nr:hypothetical protein C8K36_10823 [Rhodococcus sp. OK519]
MQLRNRKSLGHAVGGAAIIAAAALAAPALASAEPIELTNPTITTAVEENTLSVTVANPNVDPTSSCGAFALEVAKLPALRDDPSKITEPGFLSWQTDVADRVGPESQDTFSTDLADGAYAVVGECVSETVPTPAVGEPQLVTVGGVLGSVDLGSLQALLPADLDLGSLLEALPGGIGDLIAGLPLGSTAPAA